GRAGAVPDTARVPPAHQPRTRGNGAVVPPLRARAPGVGRPTLFRMTAATREPFRWPVRVYYEDTDAGGVVYYANYLKFLERARTEWLSAIGFPLSALEREHNALFVVHRLEIDYRQPARLGDLLGVTFALAERGRSRLIAAQDVLCGELLLVRARV